MTVSEIFKQVLNEIEESKSVRTLAEYSTSLTHDNKRFYSISIHGDSWYYNFEDRFLDSLESEMSKTQFKLLNKIIAKLGTDDYFADNSILKSSLRT